MQSSKGIFGGVKERATDFPLKLCVSFEAKKRERYGVLFVHVDGKYGKEGGNGLKCPISIRNTNVSG